MLFWWCFPSLRFYATVATYESNDAAEEEGFVG